ncbi:MAG: hypothetical protein MJ158_01630 [Alphaproteobacteria bacterium]|nr:hypothetical protein [Alphaproteobacteria bacterium]
MNHNLRRFFVNILCGFVPGEHRRRTIRVILNTRFLSIYRFIKTNCGIKHPKLRVVIGTRGQNLVINVSNKYVYKFRVAIDDFDDSLEQREYEITSVLAKKSPIKIVVPKVIRYAHGIARRYDFVSGIQFNTLVKCGLYKDAHDKLVKQLAEFIYKIALVDDASIEKYKKNNLEKNGYLIGWFHIDLSENFLIDKDTFDIRAVIDWEDVEFTKFRLNGKFKNNAILEQFMRDVQIEYDRLYTSLNNS